MTELKRSVSLCSHHFTALSQAERRVRSGNTLFCCLFQGLQKLSYSSASPIFVTVASLLEKRFLIFKTWRVWRFGWNGESSRRAAFVSSYHRVDIETQVEQNRKHRLVFGLTCVSKTRFSFCSVASLKHAGSPVKS